MKDSIPTCEFLLVLVFTGLITCTALAKENAEKAKIPLSSGAPALPVIPEQTFNVKDYGVIGDGKTTDTKSIQAALHAASKAGGGIVTLPAGTYLSGPLEMFSQINLRIEQSATLRMLPLKKYPGGMSDPPDFIHGKNLHDVAISGPGTIDGQGSDWWPYAKTDKTVTRPRMIHFSKCDRILIEKVTLCNSPKFHIAIRAVNVTVSGVTIRAPASTDPVNPSHNTDACDVSGNNILIRDCDVSVGDDNFTCGGDTSNVVITNCTYGNGHGVSIGSYTKGGVSNITVTDCTFSNTTSGIRIKSARDRGGIVRNLIYRNLRMVNVGCPIMIYGAYEAKEKQFRKLDDLIPEIAVQYPAAPVTEHTPIYRDITFSNITATVQSGRRAGLIWGLPEAPVSNVLLQNVTITADISFGLFNAQDVRLVDCKITTPAGVNKISTANAQVSIVPR